MKSGLLYFFVMLIINIVRIIDLKNIKESVTNADDQNSIGIFNNLLIAEIVLVSLATFSFLFGHFLFSSGAYSLASFLYYADIFASMCIFASAFGLVFTYY